MDKASASRQEVELANWYRFSERIALDVSSLSSRALPDSSGFNFNGVYALEADGLYAIWRKAGEFYLLLPSGAVRVNGDLRATVEGQKPERQVRFMRLGKSVWVGVSRIQPEHVSIDFLGWPQDEEDLEFLIFLANFTNSPERWEIPGWRDT